MTIGRNPGLAVLVAAAALMPEVAQAAPIDGAALNWAWALFALLTYLFVG